MRSKEEFNKQYDGNYFRERLPSLKQKTEAIRWVAYFDPATVLDYGCGQGYRVSEIFKQGTIAIGYDISKWAIDHPYELAEGRIFNELPNGKYDLIIAYDLLEHLHEDEVDVVLSNIAERATGAVLFSVCFIGDPNLNADPTHVTKRTRSWWENKIRSFGFEITNEHLLKTGSGDFYFLFPSQLIIARVKNESRKVE